MMYVKYIVNIFLFGFTLLITSFYSFPTNTVRTVKKSKYSFFFGSPHTYSNRYVVGPGEYRNAFIDLSTGTFYEFDNNTGGVPVAASAPHMASTYGGAHDIIAKDSLGNVWMMGDNANGECGNGTTSAVNTLTKITVDSLGNPFTNIVGIGMGGNAGGWMSYAWKSDGTLWVWGSTNGGSRGNGTWGGNTTRPVQIPMPGGVLVKQAIVSELCVALVTNGDVYTWGAGGVGGGSWTPYMLAQGNSTGVTNTPTKITLPAPAVMIASNGELANYALLNTGRLYAWSHSLDYVGVHGRDMSFYSWNPFDATDSIGLTAGAIDSIVVNSMSTIALMNDSSLNFWGDNSCGNLGNGPGIYFRHYRFQLNPANPYIYWGWGQEFSDAVIYKATHVADGKHNFTKIFGSIDYCFEWYATDVHDTIMAWGRNKYQVTNEYVTGASGTLGADQPNNWDENYVKVIRFFGGPPVIQTALRICKDSSGYSGSSSDCATWPWDGSKAGPTSVVGANITQPITQTSALLTGTTVVASGVAGRINTLWTIISQPPGANAKIPIRSGDSAYIQDMTVQGVYTIKRWTEDSNFKTDSANITVTIGCASCVTKPKGARRKYFNL